MLVLTRKLQQQIQIGDNVTITILSVKGQAVKIGIDAPRSVDVKRCELLFDMGEAKSVEVVDLRDKCEPAVRKSMAQVRRATVNEGASERFSSPVATAELPRGRASLHEMVAARRQ